MSDKHMDVPLPPERSVLAKKRPAYYNFTDKWEDRKWPAAAHHILPAMCFSRGNLKCAADKKNYVLRCIWVSKWNINGGEKHKALQKPKGQNNMVRLPTKAAYVKTYAAVRANFKKDHPVNECMHSGGWCEHYQYNKEVAQWLNDEIWDKLQEDKVKHKAKGKDILSQLQKGEKHFRDELIRRGSRTTPNGNQGTIACWLDKKDPNRSLPFSMAADDVPGNELFATKNPS
jgi:hypothetical protein